MSMLTRAQRKLPNRHLTSSRSRQRRTADRRGNANLRSLRLEPLEGRALLTAGFSQGFEVSNAGWDIFGGQYNATRVASGTHGVPSRTGAFHAEAGQFNLDIDGGSAFTRFGGYTSQFPPGGFHTSVSVYLNVGGGFANDTRFDWDSAISDVSGNFRRDFVFNAGFYNSADVTGPGAGTNRFIISASNNAGRGGSFPKNPGRDPFAITTTGWYTLEENFVQGSGGVLSDQLSIKDNGGNTLHTWALSDPSDIIGATVGGNRYGWFDYSEFSTLAFDNSKMATDVANTPDGAVPEPASMAIWGLGALGCAVAGYRRRKTA